MTVKYHCTKCQRRFVDWGAQKLEFMCPDCEEKLVVLGGSTGKTKSKPSLRRPAPVRATGPRRVSGFDSDEEEGTKSVVADDTDDVETETEGAAGFDDDDADVDLGTDDEAVEVDDSDD